MMPGMGINVGVSENSVPLNPMVNDHYPYEMAIIGIYPIFRQTHVGKTMPFLPPVTGNGFLVSTTH